MVSPLRSARGPRSAVKTVLRAMKLSNDPAKAGTSVMTLPDDSGFIVTIVEFTGMLKVHMVRIDRHGEITSLLGGREIR